MFRDLRIYQLTEVSLEAFVCTFLVHAHQPRVACHIGGENGGQPTFDTFRGQSGAPQPHGTNTSSALEAHSSGKREGPACTFSSGAPSWFLRSTRYGS